MCAYVGAPRGAHACSRHAGLSPACAGPARGGANEPPAAPPHAAERESGTAPTTACPQELDASSLIASDWDAVNILCASAFRGHARIAAATRDRLTLAAVVAACRLAGDSYGVPWDSFLHNAPLPKWWIDRLNRTVSASRGSRQITRLCARVQLASKIACVPRTPPAPFGPTQVAATAAWKLPVVRRFARAAGRATTLLPRRSSLLLQAALRRAARAGADAPRYRGHGLPRTECVRDGQRLPAGVRRHTRRVHEVLCTCCGARREPRGGVVGRRREPCGGGLRGRMEPCGGRGCGCAQRAVDAQPGGVGACVCT